MGLLGAVGRTAVAGQADDKSAAPLAAIPSLQFGRSPRVRLAALAPRRNDVTDFSAGALARCDGSTQRKSGLYSNGRPSTLASSPRDSSHSLRIIERGNAESPWFYPSGAASLFEPAGKRVTQFHSAWLSPQASVLAVRPVFVADLAAGHPLSHLPVPIDRQAGCMLPQWRRAGSRERMG